MKATGIVRRIDDLGRVVIPKEIRRTLHIRVGEPLEIYVSGDGEVIFKKYSPLGELSAFASRYAEVLARSIGRPVLVADRDHIIAVSGTARKELLDQRITADYERSVETRRPLSAAERGPLLPFASAPLCAIFLAPILAQGDVIGSIALLGGPDELPSEIETKLLTVAAAVLGRQMED